MYLGNYSPYLFEDKDDIQFDPSLYSKFKYGSKDAARTMGKDMAEKFISSEVYNSQIYPSLSNKQIVVIPSPSNFIPTATFALKDYFISEFNPWLVEQGLLPVQELKIHRTTSYTMDYGKMSKEDRKQAIDAEYFHIDRAFLKDKFVIFMDDIKITGSHEDKVSQMIDRELLYLQDCDWMFMYYAQLRGNECNPDIEDYLNYYAISDLYSLNKMIRNEGFVFNTRVVKFILQYDSAACYMFLQFQSKDFLHTLYHLAIGNSYHLPPEFKTNFEVLKSLVNGTEH